MSRAPAASAKLLEMLDGCRVVQALYVAASLGVADLLGNGPKRSEELAREIGADARSLHRLLRALASLGVLEERHDGRFVLTEVGDLLRSDVPGSLRAAILLAGGRRHWTTWGRLLESVKSGKTAFGTWSSSTFLEMAQRDPEGARIFNEAMAALTAPVNTGVTAAYDFSPYRTLVDVGGGYGALLSGVLAANPPLRGVLFDIPPVIEGARDRINAAGLAERCELIAGDAFESVPSGGDAYILKWVLHDWDDDSCLRILRNCRETMRDDTRLLVIERIVPRRAAPAPGDATKFLSDLNMLLLSGGCERTEEEYRRLLAAAGFSVRRTVATTTPHCIIEAEPR
jgi:hypothetical protein